MGVLTTLRTLALEDVDALVAAGDAAFVDLRPVDAYLDVHIPGSLELLYEFGPGMASRARDCLPLSLPLVLLDLGVGDLDNAAAALRGKGFSVPGRVEDGINRWADLHGTPASIDVVRGSPPRGTLLDVGDPGVASMEGAQHIPIEKLWTRVGDVAGDPPIVILAGFGVRAALAVGMLERAGVEDIAFWRTREPGASRRG